MNNEYISEIHQINQLQKDKEWCVENVCQPFPPILGINQRRFSQCLYNFSRLPFTTQQLIAEPGCNIGFNTFILNMLYPNSVIHAWDINAESIRLAKAYQRLYRAAGVSSVDNIFFETIDTTSYSLSTQRYTTFFLHGLYRSLTHFYHSIDYNLLSECSTPFSIAISFQDRITYESIANVDPVKNAILTEIEVERTEKDLQYQLSRGLKLFKHSKIVGASLLWLSSLSTAFTPDEKFLVEEEWEPSRR